MVWCGDCQVLFKETERLLADLTDSTRVKHYYLNQPKIITPCCSYQSYPSSYILYYPFNKVILILFLVFLKKSGK